MEVLAGKVAVYHEALPDTHAIDAAELLMAVEFSSRKGNAHTARPSQAIFLPSQYTIQAFGNPVTPIRAGPYFGASVL